MGTNARGSIIFEEGYCSKVYNPEIELLFDSEQYEEIEKQLPKIIELDWS